MGNWLWFHSLLPNYFPRLTSVSIATYMVNVLQNSGFVSFVILHICVCYYLVITIQAAV